LSELACGRVPDWTSGADLVAAGERVPGRAPQAGPVVAGIVIGDVRDVSRFPARDHFAACNGTAPIEVSSGQRTGAAPNRVICTPRTCVARWRLTPGSAEKSALSIEIRDGYRPISPLKGGDLAQAP